MTRFNRPIAISGDLGSGKSTVGRLLAERLGVQFLSTGEIHREIALRNNVTTLELNLRAEADTRIDEEVDQVLKDLAQSGECPVVDSGWLGGSSAVLFRFTSPFLRWSEQIELFPVIIRLQNNT